MEAFDDWILVPTANSFDPAEKVQEIYVNTDDEEKSESSSSKSDSSSSDGEVVKNSSCSTPSHHELGDSVKIVAASRNTLWATGVDKETRVSDLIALFSKYGKVSNAKIVTNSKTPGTRYYGVVTMASNEDILVCIDKLNKTKLHDPTITVKKTTIEANGSIKRSDLKSMQSKVPLKKKEKSAESSEDVTPIPSPLPNSVTNISTPVYLQSTKRHLLESFKSLTKTCHLKTEKMPRKQDMLQQTVEVSNNTGPRGKKDIPSTDSSGTSNQRKLDKNTNKGIRLPGVKTVVRGENVFRNLSIPPFLFPGERYSFALQLCCTFVVLFMFTILDAVPKSVEFTSLNDTITELQRENLLLKRQIFYNQRKENRKLNSLSNLVSIKFEEKENVTRKYLQQLELETSYLKEIHSLKEEKSFLEAKCKILENQITESSSIVEKTDKEYDNVKSKPHEPVSILTYFLLSVTLAILLVCLLSLPMNSALSEIQRT